MGTLSRKLGFSERSPLIAIEWCLALSSLVGGLWVLVIASGAVSLDISTASALIQTLASTVGLLLLAAFVLSASVFIIVGIIGRHPKLRATGHFITGLARMYAWLATIFGVGILPLSWLSNFTLMIISFYIWRRIRRRGIE